ncbi:hypothetical protein J2Z69_000746 [Paenibacillus shirakamiensis]|uniref:HNH endonuclease n=1 Tax=Paenibacillus shirakamiensis TaxID=1265935 RepID=A0ABS4JDC8_9BACL|nr:hypothetical protein [Paenibacillus shirakamiensis]MBP1999727.1 hypothetical protein [Paenibacillus shirakamiensis]
MPAYSKEEQVKKIRHKPKRGRHTAITDKCSNEVKRRAAENNPEGYLVCERCGCSRPSVRFERAHLINASQYGEGGQPWNIVLLCGPKTETGTCHQWVDETKVGNEWKMEKRRELLNYYTIGPGRGWQAYTKE